MNILLEYAGGAYDGSGSIRSPIDRIKMIMNTTCKITYVHTYVCTCDCL
jgi:hypothetical protein